MTGINEKQVFLWGMLCHLAALLGYIVPFGNILGPLVIWLIMRDDAPFIDVQGKESLNFQISISLYAVIATILTVLLIGFALLIALGIANLLFVTIASVKAGKGELYRYPCTIRFVR